MFEVLKPTIGAQSVTFSRLQVVKGKTIKDFEFGYIETPKDVHQAEMIIFHFTDGTSLSITTGSNAWNLSHEFKGLKPKDVHTDLIAENHALGETTGARSRLRYGRIDNSTCPALLT